VGRYWIGGYSSSVIDRLDVSVQNELSDTSYTQTSSSTTFKFKKPLDPAYGITAPPDDPVYIIWAYGNGNSFSYHDEKGVLQVPLIFMI